MTAKILVTGASGYTGSRVAMALAGAGFEVHVLLRAASAKTYLAHLDGSIVRHDYGQPQDLQKLVSKIGPNAICHLAAVSESVTRPENIRRLINSNVLFGTELMEAATAAGCRSMVMAGTYWQHFDGPSLAPNSLYAATKIALHAIAQYYAILRGMRFVELILFDIYGPGDQRGKILSLFDKAVGADEVISLTGGEQLISPSHIDDVVAAFCRSVTLLLEGDATARVASYAAPGPDLLSLREMAAVYEAVRGTRLNVQWGVKPYPPGQIFRPYIGPTIPGWAPQRNFESGLRQIYA